MRLRNLSLFSGIGGLELGAEWAGIETVGFVERDPYCRRVLNKHWPNVPILDDVCELTEQALSSFGSFEILSGGFPCQPHSVAGKRKASGDKRDLWQEFARIIREASPRWVVAENVPGLRSSESGRFFGRVLQDLAGMGYNVSWVQFGAYEVGAPHLRERIFFLAHSDGRRKPQPKGSQQKLGRRTIDSGEVFPMAHPDDAGLYRREVAGDAQRGKQKGSLNPEWVCWLMGFPDGWLDLPEETHGKKNRKSKGRQ